MFMDVPVKSSLRVVSRPMRAFLFVGALAVALVACKPRSSDPAQAPSRAGEPAPVVIRFADPANAGIYAYARKTGVLERELAKVNAKIEWVPANGAFSANFEAMNTGAINASGGAISPIIGALSRNLPFKIFAITERTAFGKGRAGVIVPKDSPVKTLADLAGKRVAVNLAAHGDYILLRALEVAKLPLDAVQRVPIQPPDAAAAFASGKLDAWSTFGTFFTAAVRNGARIVVDDADVKSDDAGVLAGHVDVLKRNPVAFLTLIRVAQELTAEAHEHPEAFQNVFTDKGPTAVKGDDLRLAIEDTRVLAAPRAPEPGDLERVAAVGKLFVASKSINHTIPVDEIVFDLNAAAKQQKLSSL
jgi:sulfonate transport system substrate-binding protein